MVLEKNPRTRLIAKHLLRLEDKIDGKPFAGMTRAREISNYSCGSATMEMLLSYVGIKTTQTKAFKQIFTILGHVIPECCIVFTKGDTSENILSVDDDSYEEIKERHDLNDIMTWVEIYKDFFKTQYNQQLYTLNKNLLATRGLIKQIQNQQSLSESLIEDYKQLLERCEVTITDLILAFRNNINFKISLNQHQIKELQIINEINYWNQ